LGAGRSLRERSSVRSGVWAADQRGAGGWQTRRPRVGTEEWYGLEILDTLAVK